MSRKPTNSEILTWLQDWQDLQAYGVERSTKAGLRPEDVSRLIDEYRRAK